VQKRTIDLLCRFSTVHVRYRRQRAK